MEKDKMNERIVYITHTIGELIHEGLRYWNYTSLIIGVVCVFAMICIEAAPDLDSIEIIMLNVNLSIVMPLITGCYLFRDISRFLFSISRNKRALMANIIRYIFYHVLTLLLLSMMAIETIAGYILILMPTGIVITIFVYAMVLLLTGKNNIDDKRITVMKGEIVYDQEKNYS